MTDARPIRNYGRRPLPLLTATGGMLWATARRVGIAHLITEDLQDGFALGGVRFSNPFNAANDELIERILPP